MAFSMHQIGKGQDCAGAGKVGIVEYIFAADGHGRDAAIDAFRAINKDEMAASRNPMEYVLEHIRRIDTYQSGFALVLARKWPGDGITNVDLWWVGDARAQVFFMNRVYFTTENHNHDNPEEVSRIATRVAAVKNITAPFAVTPTRVESLPITMTAFKQADGRSPYFIAMTQAFGHNGATGFEPSYHSFRFRDGDAFRVVCGSDGFFDMPVDGLTTKTAEELAGDAVALWQSDKWEFFDGKKTAPSTWGGIYDDVCVAVM